MGGLCRVVEVCKFFLLAGGNREKWVQGAGRGVVNRVMRS